MPVRDKGVGTVVTECDGVAEKRRGTVTEAGRFASVTGKGVVSARVRNYAADSFFLRKAAEAKAEIDRVGLPKRKKQKKDT